MPPRIVRYPPIQCNTRERQAQSKIPIAPPAWRIPEGPESLAAVPVGGGRAWPWFEQTHNRASAAGVEGAGGSGGHGRASKSTTPSEARVWRSRGRPGPKAPATPAAPQATTSSAERSSRRGRLAGGPPPTGAPSSRAQTHTKRRPEHQRCYKQRAPDTRKPRPADAGRGQPTQSGGKV